jgi:hypothetical protein
VVDHTVSTFLKMEVFMVDNYFQMEKNVSIHNIFDVMIFFACQDMKICIYYVVWWLLKECTDFLTVLHVA